MMGEIKSFTQERLLELFYAMYEKDAKKFASINLNKHNYIKRLLPKHNYNCYATPYRARSPPTYWGPVISEEICAVFLGPLAKPGTRLGADPFCNRGGLLTLLYWINEFIIF
ncbi:Protein ACTIVITY OF BC1 COMPLEX KINASE 7, chloroplastic [Glycine soja]